MIFYATNQTFRSYGLKTAAQLSEPMASRTMAVIERDTGDALIEWGLKVFYFDGRKCLQAVNFACKFTLFMFDIKKKEFENLGDLMAHYLLSIYENDPRTIKYLHRMFADDRYFAVAPLKNKSIIATLNHNQSDYALNGYRFRNYVSGGILHTMKINNDFNFEYSVTYKAIGRPDYFYPGELYRELLHARYSS